MKRRGEIHQRYETVRSSTLELCKPLEPEDYIIQSMADASPVKWHLAHTTWFFETLILLTFHERYRTPHPAYRELFNSYYNTVGPQFERARRGVLSRPTVSETFAYRLAVDAAVHDLIEEANERQAAAFLPILETGLQHEEQHQELLLTDIKHGLAQNPLDPSYLPSPTTPPKSPAAQQRFVELEGGKTHIGHASDGYAYDNERKAHPVWLQPFAISANLVSNVEYMEFMEDRGYKRPELWLSDGWDWVQRTGVRAPLYWCREPSGAWGTFTLRGRQRLVPTQPLCHVSHFEADAFARWAGLRLPTEFEWEHAATTKPGRAGTFVDQRHFHPVGSSQPAQDGLAHDLMGEVWEWTGSAYLPYPGYRPPPGTLAEYNGKFMSGQMVLRGGSCASVRSHLRPTYRNFFHPEKRWQFAGFRLAYSL